MPDNDRNNIPKPDNGDTLANLSEMISSAKKKVEQESKAAKTPAAAPADNVNKATARPDRPSVPAARPQIPKPDGDKISAIADRVAAAADKAAERPVRPAAQAAEGGAPKRPSQPPRRPAPPPGRRPPQRSGQGRPAGAPPAGARPPQGRPGAAAPAGRPVQGVNVARQGRPIQPAAQAAKAEAAEKAAQAAKAEAAAQPAKAAVKASTEAAKPVKETAAAAKETPKPAAETLKALSDAVKAVKDNSKASAENPKAVDETAKPSADTAKPAAETPKAASETSKPEAVKKADDKVKSSEPAKTVKDTEKTTKDTAKAGKEPVKAADDKDAAAEKAGAAKKAPERPAGAPPRRPAPDRKPGSEVRRPPTEGRKPPQPPRRAPARPAGAKAPVAGGPKPAAPEGAKATERELRRRSALERFDEEFEKELKEPAATTEEKAPADKKRIKLIVGLILGLILLLGGAVLLILNHYLGLFDRSEKKWQNSQAPTYSDVDFSRPDTMDAVTADEKLKELRGKAEPISNKDVMNILLIGEDLRDTATEDAGNTDVMMVISVNKKDKTITETSIMRDCYVYFPDYGYSNRINAAYWHGGIELTQKTIEDYLGLKIDRYVLVNFKVFIDIVDTLGGLDLTVTDEEAHGYEGADPNGDNTRGMENPLDEQNKYLGNKKGTDYIKKGGDLHLNGNQALAYARLRHVGNSDYERTARQRKVIKEMIKKSKKLSIIEMDKLANKIFPQIKTDVTEGEMAQLLIEMLDYRNYKVQEFRVPMDDTYTNEVINGMDILNVDFWTNSEMLKKKVYGSIATDEEGNEADKVIE